MKLLTAIFLSCMLVACGKTTTETPATSSSAAAPKKPEPPKIEFKTLRAAIAGTRLTMSDTTDGDLSPGAAVLALWSAENMTWDELQEIPEGKYGLVMKDPDTQRGSRICAVGRVIEIAREKSTAKRIYTGGMFDNNMRIYRFIAVGDTGEIEAGSNAKFCGVVTGKVSYQNSAGGTAHGINLVGMFKLPQKKSY